MKTLTTSQSSRISVWTIFEVLRIATAVAIAWIAWSDQAARSEAWPVNMPVLSGLLAAVLWLTITGFFGYGSANRRDWPVLIPFGLALIVREGLTLHSVQEIEIQFAQTPVGRHSVVYPLFQLLFMPHVSDPQLFMMHMNGVLGAVATLPLYLFVRQRTDRPPAAFLCACFFALHPLLARFAPTDGPYSFLLVTWFAGLALLSTPDLDHWAMLGGATLVGMAATTRIEGSVLLLASLMLLDPRRLLAGVRRSWLSALLAVAVIVGQLSVHMRLVLPNHMGTNDRYWDQISQLSWILEDAFRPLHADRVFWVLMWIGGGAGLLFKRCRLGLVSALVTLVMLIPALHAGNWIVAVHRMVPSSAVQAITAGIGAYAVGCLAEWAVGSRWLGVVPGALAALYIAVGHRRELTTPYVFTEEYDLVRRHLAPAVAPDHCTLLTLNLLSCTPTSTCTALRKSSPRWGWSTARRPIVSQRSRAAAASTTCARQPVSTTRKESHPPVYPPIALQTAIAPLA